MKLGLSCRWGRPGSTSAIWRTVDDGDIKQLDGSFLHERTHTLDPLPPVGAATGTTPLHSVAAVCTTRSLGSKFRIRFRINYVIYRGYWSRKGSHFAVSANYFMRSLVIGIPAHEASYASPDNREQLLSRAGLDRQSSKTATCFRMNASTVMGGVPVSSSTSVLVPAKTPF